ncbi:MAG TPA: four helix bundle protein [Gemmatimonadales bacterium]|nr:four helix bundle protein [Gemmatimonadales bacterium]
MRRDIEALDRSRGSSLAAQIARMPGDLVDLLVWREAASLAHATIAAARSMHGIGSLAAADQLARAAESIPANIAEAYGRGFGRDGARFLRVARGSATELESHLWLAERTGRVPGQLAAQLLRQTQRVRALLRWLMRATAAHAARG